MCNFDFPSGTRENSRASASLHFFFYRYSCLHSLHSGDEESAGRVDGVRKSLWSDLRQKGISGSARGGLEDGCESSCVECLADDSNEWLEDDSNEWLEDDSNECLADDSKMY